MTIRTVKLPQDRPMDAMERGFVREAVRGLKITGSKWVKNLLVPHDRNGEILDRLGSSEVTTIEYPEERSPTMSRSYRAMHRLTFREDGKPRCVACYMCSTACPAHCIYIEAGEYPDDPIEKYPVRFDIDELKCIVCGLCVEACPKDAIRMDTGRHCTASLNRGAAIYSREQLLHESQPFGPTHPHGDENEMSREALKYLQAKGERPRGSEEKLEERIGPDHRR